jgi:hypothetical protein
MAIAVPDKNETAGVKGALVVVDHVDAVSVFDPEQFMEIVSVDRVGKMGLQLASGIMATLAGADVIGQMKCLHGIIISESNVSTTQDMTDLVRYGKGTMKTATPRLSEQQVADYRHDGYIIYDQPVFSPSKFADLKAFFEDLLAELPSDQRPEGMDVPHFQHPELNRWLLDDEVLDLVEPLIGSDIALFSSHFICKPKGNGKRVPWHEDSAYWIKMLAPMEVVTVWLAIDPSTIENGCMYVIPATHNTGKQGFSDYDPVDKAFNVFPTEITATQRNDAQAKPCILQAGQASLHDGRLIHGSPPNTSNIRRCGYTMRYIPTHVKLSEEAMSWHQIYLARGQDRAGNQYANPGRAYPELARTRVQSGKRGH